MTESLGYSRLREEGGGGGGSARREEGKRGERGGCNTSALMEGDTKYNVEQEGGEFGLLLNSVGINNTGLLFSYNLVAKRHPAEITIADTVEPPTRDPLR